jgi:hypothetical protein
MSAVTDDDRTVPPADASTDAAAPGADPVPEEVSYEGQFYPARPARLRPRARLRDRLWQRKAKQPGSPTGDNPDYVSWLVDESMLADATTFARQFAGQGSMWQNPYAAPDPRAAIDKAAVWFTAYPISMITKAGGTFLGTLGDEDLWSAFESDRHHRHSHRPGQAGRRDHRLGDHAECGRPLRPHFHAVRRHVRHRGRVPRDVRGRRRPRRPSSTTSCPGHTGKGADFRLAEMKVGDYPGIYHMVEIPKEDWGLLPWSPRVATRSTSTRRPSGA